MLCLSVKQPWAECLVNGSKSIEIRTWQPPRDVCDAIRAALCYPERREYPLFAIHAGKQPDLQSHLGRGMTESERKALMRVWFAAGTTVVRSVNDAPVLLPTPGSLADRLGGIVGFARLIGWHWYQTEQGKSGRERFVREIPLHLNPAEWWREGLCAWEFAAPTRLAGMIVMRGQLGVFEVPEEVEAPKPEGRGGGSKPSHGDAADVRGGAGVRDKPEGIVMICLLTEHLPIPPVRSNREMCLRCGREVWVDASGRHDACMCLCCALTEPEKMSFQVHPDVRRTLHEQGITDVEIERTAAAMERDLQRKGERC